MTIQKLRRYLFVLERELNFDPDETNNRLALAGPIVFWLRDRSENKDISKIRNGTASVCGVSDSICNYEFGVIFGFKI